MSIVPQIALVKPNREVRQYVEPSPEVLREAISESNGSGQLTLQKGVYGAENPGQNVTVPLGIDIIVMPGADISRVNFFDPDGNQFPNIFDFNNLGNIAQVVNTLSTGDGLQVDQNTDDVTIKVPENGIVTSLLASDSVNSDALATNNNPSAGQVLGYNGSVITWQPADVNTEDPIGGTGLSGSPVQLRRKDSSSVSFRVDNNKLVADVRENGITQTMISSGSVGSEQLNVDGNAGSSTFLGYHAGLEWKELSADDITGGTFSGSYTFSQDVTVSGDLFLSNDVELNDNNGNKTGELRTGSDGFELQGFGSAGNTNLLLETSSGSVKIDANNSDVLAQITLDASNRVEAKTNLRVSDDNDLVVSTDDSNMENVSGSRIEINHDGYMDFPMYDNKASPSEEPPAPPDGYIRVYAITGDSGNEAGKYRFVEPGGGRSTINI